MSGGAVYQHCLRALAALELDPHATRDVLCALEAAREDALLTVLYEAVSEASLDRDDALSRAAGVFFLCAAGNLADDLVDDECTYFDPPFDVRPTRVAPAVQYLLMHLSTATLARSLPASTMGTVALELARATGPHQTEVRTTHWDLETYRRVGYGIAARQWAAHMRALWAATPLETDADAVGFGLGFCTHVVHDVRDGDPRFFTLPAHDREELLREAETRLDEALARGRRVAMLVEPTLRHGLKNAVVAAWYDAKTRQILDRYGPGPRVHYHTGVCDDDAPLPKTRIELKKRIHDAQEAVLHESLLAWRLHDKLAGRRILDAGCGLGGTALLLAAAGAHVTAQTICAPHAEIVKELAMQAKVAHLVDVRVGDVGEMTDTEAFDDIVSFEASCYFDRAAFFAAASRALRPGGRVLLVDLFAGRDDVKPLFDGTWRTDLGTLESYERAAEMAHFERGPVDDISKRCAPFWDLTRADSERLLQACTDVDERARLTQSLASHVALQTLARDGGLKHLRAVFTKGNP